MDKIIFLLILGIFLIVSIFFREETGIKTTTIVVISLALIYGFIKIFLKSNENK